MPDSYREVSEQALAELFDYWAARCQGRRMPARRDIDPLEIPRKHLPDLMLIEVFHDPIRFRYRLIGTRVVAASGENRTGRFFHEVPFFTGRSLVIEQFRQVAATGRPLYSLEPFRNFIENTTYQVDRLLLPLSSDGKQVDMLMVGFHFKTGPYAAAP